MKTVSKYNIHFFAGLLLSIPAGYFILISVLKYGLGRDYLFDISWPILQRWGIQESFGWNINLLILMGPVLALLLNIISVLHVRFLFSRDKIDCQLSIVKSWRNLAVVLLSGNVVFVLTAYLFLENCSC
jgi:hypothetical protein